MKLRIQDSSVRFRITIRELEQLTESGCLVRETRVPDGRGGSLAFRYEVRTDPSAEESKVELSPYTFALVLGRRDFAEFSDPEQEGAYVRREWEEDGETRRFLIFIEKDRPGSTCVKQEAWIYELNPGGTPSTVPKPSKARSGTA